MQTALLIIDVQNDYFPGGRCVLHNPEAALENARTALARFRAANLPVIHVKHINTREGATFFLPGTEGAEIHADLTPVQGEMVVIKHAPSSFLNTDLSAILREKQISHLVVCGMMTHMCIDTTVRACMDHGVTVTLLMDACATKDLMLAGERIPAGTVHRTFMAALNGMFANIIQTGDLMI